ncbi:glucokinase [Dictyobacter alpinus]|uniref:Glucokinase n=1 Tax=Dictyobacter alpinus TaxID=2014873 RepID=A0A402B1K5_9CHLR|nr:ROK family protein [Dictyobacter alpinus]GCE25219.1 glucokinase [Dictyobacter alpinus]
MSVAKGVAVGVEIGSKQTTVALIDQEGHIQQRCLARTLYSRSAIATLDPYLRAIDMMLKHARDQELEVLGIGVSLPGSVDDPARRPLQVPILPSLNNFPLSDLLESRYNLPAHIYADVDAAMLGEHRFGSGKAHQRLLYLTINAVVGASLVIDGHLESSNQQYIGHVCHVPIATKGPRCSCGKYGCINTLLSIEAIKRMVQRALRRGEETTLTQRIQRHEVFSHRLLGEEAARGDNLALQIYRELARWLVEAMTRYISLFEPGIFILGGGVLYGGEVLLAQIRMLVGDRFSLPSCQTTEVVPACLGSDAALIGAIVPFARL